MNMPKKAAVMACIMVVGVFGVVCASWGDSGGLEPMQMRGKASYYTEASCKREGTSGIWTASGERFDEGALTCALRRRDWGGLYKVTNLATGMSVVVRHNDYGPGRGPTRKGVVIDLSPKAMRAIAPKGVGMITVTVESV